MALHKVVARSESGELALSPGFPAQFVASACERFSRANLARRRAAAGWGWR